MFVPLIYLKRVPLVIYSHLIPNLRFNKANPTDQYPQQCLYILIMFVPLIYLNYVPLKDIDIDIVLY